MLYKRVRSWSGRVRPSLLAFSLPTLPGAALTLALSLLQVRRADSPSWLLVPLSASGGTAIGLVYPYIVGGKGDAPDGSKVMRCVAVFVGIYQATTVSSQYKTPFDL